MWYEIKEVDNVRPFEVWECIESAEICIGYFSTIEEAQNYIEDF